MSGPQVRAPVSAPVLCVRFADGRKETIELGEEPITIGRSAKNRVVIDQPAASRRHAQIECQEGHFLLVDQGSKNGTLVNGELLRGRLLRSGDVIEFGETSLVFMAPEPAADGTTEPSAEERQGGAGGGAPLGLADFPKLLDFCRMLQDADEELTVLERAAVDLAEVVPCEVATIVLMEEGSENPLMRFSSRADEEETGTVDDRLAQASVTTERAVRLSVPRHGAVQATLGARRHVLLVPLRVGGRKVGVAIVERDPQEEPFAETEFHQIQIAGSHLSMFLKAVL